MSVLVAGLLPIPVLVVPAQRIANNRQQGPDYICATGTGERPTYTTQAHLDFGSSSWLSVQTNDESRLLSDASRTILAGEIANAMMIWRRVCAHCVTGNLSVLQIDRNLYVDGYLAGALRSGDLNHIVSGPPTQNTVTVAPGKQPIYFDILTALIAARYGTRTVIVPFEQVKQSDALFNNICSANYDSLPELFKSTRLALKCPQDIRREQPKPATLGLYILNGYTSCGRNMSIIGCSADDLVVELNAKDYRYTDSGVQLFGLGEHDVDFFHVILHEFGHWIGLPHLYTEGNLMFPSLAGSKCIDNGDIAALNDMVLGEAERRKGKGAFYFSNPPMQR